MYIQKAFRILFFVATLEAIDEKSRIGIRTCDLLLYDFIFEE
jgi:hypothetical protein